MNRLFISFSIFFLLALSCTSNVLKEPQRYDYLTAGPLTDDCFQVIITVPPDKEFRTMTEQRENAFIKAKDSIITETEKQFISYYSTDKSISADAIPAEKLSILKEKSGKYSRLGIIEEEYYLADNSAVLVIRIFKKGIKNEIINN